MPRPRPVVTAVAAALLGGALVLPAAADLTPPSLATQVADYGFQGEGEGRIGDVDRRVGVLAPTDAQRAAAAELGADVRWGPLGTPSSVAKASGDLSAPREGAAADVARAFLRDNADLLGLDAAAVDGLEVIGDTPLYDAPDLARLRDGLAPQNTEVAHVVLLRQVFGELSAAQDGLAAVGVTRNGAVTYLSSSLTRDVRLTGERRLDAVQAYTKAAADVGRDVAADAVSVTEERDGAGFTRLAVEGLADVQYARLRALPTPQDGVRPVWETVVLDADAEHGHPEAYISFVDAESGAVLFRTNRVDHLAHGVAPTTQAAANPSSGPFSGKTAEGGDVGDTHLFDVGTGMKSIVLAAHGNPNGPANDGDVVLGLERRQADGTFETVFSQDLVTSEAALFAPAGGVQPGTYRVVVTAFVKNAGAVSYVGYFQPSALGAPSVSASPRWEVFASNPAIADPAKGDAPATDTRSTWCWDEGPGCDLVLRNTASRAPWDVDARSGLPTFTVTGNNARTAPSYLSFLTPDAGAAYQPVSPTREYDFGFTNQWYTSACNPASFATGNRNDIDAASVNLFVGHNRIHDWSYFLGFTERTWNLQAHNFGQPSQQGVVPTASQGGDPELGQSQAGAIGGGPAFTGRDNANQITLQDGIPGITNQYLWQPLQAGFYAPCVDGAYDQSVIAHEYGHAIQNRMVAGPDSGLSSAQGRSMGESWSDLTAIEYLNAYGYAGQTGEDPFSVGAYVTGDKDSGIRNYNMSRSPLNYSNLEYDGNGVSAASPHANGEIWSATNFDIRQRLIADHDARFPSTDRALQVTCADGKREAQLCPGNRQWAQIMHDAFLLQQAGTSMLDARDAYLAADRLRFGGANQRALWDVFASRGMGEKAVSEGGNDVSVQPDFSSAVRTDEAVVQFQASSADAGAPAGLKVFVGDYEARVTPTAVAEGAAPTASTAFVPGTYRFLATAPGFGAVRFERTFTAGQTGVVEVPMRKNLASPAHGAAASGDGINLDKLVDGTEATNWASKGSDVAGKQVTVKLGDTPVDVAEVAVSAALRPAVAGDADTGGQSRFSALRSFEILTCNAVDPAKAGCVDAASFTSVLTSAPDAFPGSRPRPTSPDLTLRPFDVTDSKATHVRIVVLANQCTGGPLYTGAANPDADPVNDPDCVNGRTGAAATGGSLSLSQARNVRIAELQVLGPLPVAVQPAPAPAPEPAPTKPGRGSKKDKTTAQTSVVG